MNTTNTTNLAGDFENCYQVTQALQAQREKLTNEELEPGEAYMLLDITTSFLYNGDTSGLIKAWECTLVQMGIEREVTRGLIIRNIKNFLNI